MHAARRRWCCWWVVGWRLRLCRDHTQCSSTSFSRRFHVNEPGALASLVARRADGEALVRRQGKRARLAGVEGRALPGDGENEEEPVPHRTAAPMSRAQQRRGALPAVMPGPPASGGVCPT